MAKANVFKTAKRLKSKYPNKSWQQIVQIAAKGGTAAKPKKKAVKKKAAKKKKVGAYKVIERNETKSTPTKKVYRATRSKKGTFKGMVTVGAVKQFHEDKLKAAMWKHEKATTIKATKEAAAEMRKHRAALKKL